MEIETLRHKTLHKAVPTEFLINVREHAERISKVEGIIVVNGISLTNFSRASAIASNISLATSICRDKYFNITWYIIMQVFYSFAKSDFLIHSNLFKTYQP